jgi:hypothetical protein
MYRGMSGEKKGQYRLLFVEPRPRTEWGRTMYFEMLQSGKENKNRVSCQLVHRMMSMAMECRGGKMKKDKRNACPAAIVFSISG